MLNYLIIGDANSMHIFNYVQNVLGFEKYHVALLTLSTKRVREEYRNFYQQHNVKLYSIAEQYGSDVPNGTKKQRIVNFLRKFKLAKSLPKFDVCHIHSVYKTSLVFYLLNKRKFKTLIASYWGGDIEDRSKFLVKLRAKCFRKANVITVTAQQTLQDFHGIYGTKFDEKLKICRFATAGIECVKKVFTEHSVPECKEILGFPKDKFCITCGYSAYAEQHQDTMVKQISTLPQEIKDRIFISVPMQYGVFEESYMKSVYSALENSGCQYTVLREYFPFEKKAAEAIATDLYLHMRDTDAFSNSLKEQVYAGTSVVIGTWLKYPELEQMKADVIWADSFDELPEIVLNCMKQPKEKRLFDTIYDLYSFEAVKKQWNEVIDFAVRKI
ncbi:MAG: glycosyltransferase [Ruminococcaceae bacterium]|nr:glycosyltransferase [Oscillospiraceae bacterium]